MHAFLVFLSCLKPISNEQALCQIQHLNTTRVHPYQAMLCINVIFLKLPSTVRPLEFIAVSEVIPCASALKDEKNTFIFVKLM